MDLFEKLTLDRTQGRVWRKPWKINHENVAVVQEGVDFSNSTSRRTPSSPKHIFQDCEQNVTILCF